MANAIGIAASAVLFICLVFFIKHSLRVKIGNWFSEKWCRVWLMFAFFICFNGFLMVITKSWNTEIFLQIAFYLFAPTWILFLAQPCCPDNHNSLRSGWTDILIVLLLWLPVETEIISTGWKMGKSSYPLVTLGAMLFALIVYQMRKREFSLDWSIKTLRGDILTALIYFAILAAILIPLALAIDFANGPALNHKLPKKLPGYPWILPAVFAGIWFAPALIEEIIFRGVIQNVLVEKFKPKIGILVASVIFGFSHINNATKYYREDGTVVRYDYPNWRYVLLATIAGFGYGLIYWKRKKAGSGSALGAAALLHCIVDFVWLLLFKDNM